MAGVTSGDWSTVAAAVRGRRESIGLTQEEAAARSGGFVSTSNWRVIEAAGRDSYRAATLNGVCRVLGWTPDSIDRLLRGEPPVVSSLPVGMTVKEMINPEGTMLERHEERLASIEEDLRALIDRVDELLSGQQSPPSAEVLDFPAAAHKGDAKKKGGRKVSRPQPEPEPEGP